VVGWTEMERRCRQAEAMEEGRKTRWSWDGWSWTLAERRLLGRRLEFGGSLAMAGSVAMEVRRTKGKGRVLCCSLGKEEEKNF
jgi:YD repeat-containing protein